ncbi:unnamed protein product [Bemisia tabaci]|uniref:Uncharacterized protein n=1 Tax=Bemisia tabaci TaxID=7038 RepID=A0A9N9ZX55_BEMTA|nr:unnamed protein product [Bemisia tabaci]
MSPRSHFSPNSGTPPVHGQRHQQRNSYAASPSFPGPAFPDNSFGVEGGPFNALLGFDLLQGAPADFPSVVRTEIKNLLERSNDGLSILVYFEKNQTLSNSLRSKLVQIVIEHECRGDPGRKITTDRFIELAAMIAKTFPNESPAAYYVPFSIENGRQKNAQGKLWARYNNQKRLYRSTGLLKSARHHDSLFSDMFFLSAR